jgi:hypothetical protein
MGERRGQLAFTLKPSALPTGHASLGESLQSDHTSAGLVPRSKHDPHSPSAKPGNDRELPTKEFAFARPLANRDQAL